MSTTFYYGILLLLFGMGIILTTISLRRRPANPTDGAPANKAALFFLVALRLGIGWHCLIEGLDKFTAATWSSEAYLRESVGPFSGFFRYLAGDRLLEKINDGAEKQFPARLEREWRDYADVFATFHELESDKRIRMETIIDQRKSDTLSNFASKAELVTKISPYPPEYKLEMTIKQRLAEHERLQKIVVDVEARMPTKDTTVHADWKSAKADLAKWRAGFAKTIADETASFKEALKKDLLTKEQQALPMPESPGMRLRSWGMLEYSDLLVKTSLVVFGTCMLLGLLSRVSAGVLATLLLSFYLAMPAIPGYPESPRLEGHYIFINKTLIEVIALAALACLPTGRWAGLDALLAMTCCKLKTV
ncbi:MAG: hypothetical protein EXS16_10565 [Gemmataceae bacterium]|nr:hypothetical protein [Gemmataceae bacterium]